MPKYVVAADRMFEIEAESPEEAEEELARRINDNEVTFIGKDCQTYEEIPRE